MLTKPLAWLAVATLTAGTAFAQDNASVPPPPPAPPADQQAPPPPPPRPEHPHPPGDAHREGGPGRDGGPGPGRHHEAGTLLGVAVDELPRALTSQLNLPEGFGVMVNFVVPGSAAEAAGVQPDDVLKMLNDQILVNPDQLSTLVRSYPDGQDVTLTAIRKGQETKLTVKLKKQALPPDGDRPHGPPREGERPNHRMMMPGPDGTQADADNDGDDDSDLHAPPAPPAPPIRDIVRALRPELKELAEINPRVADRLQHEITILRERDGASRHTRLDLADARIVVRDDKGELDVVSDAGKRSLTAKDPQGKVLFTGPVNTPDERKAVPADILPRLEKLEKDELPAFPEAPKPDGAQNTSLQRQPDLMIPLSASTDTF